MRKGSVETPHSDAESLSSINNSRLLRKNSTEPVALADTATSLESLKNSLMNRTAAAITSSRERVAPVMPEKLPSNGAELNSAPEREPDSIQVSPLVTSPLLMGEISQAGSPSGEDGTESRPGLGPMIKSQPPKGTLNHRWRAAAAAVTATGSAIAAFKPRPGGAGDKLRQAKAKVDGEPDGITGVVPAPPRPVPIPELASKAPDPAPIDVPVVTVTVPVPVPNASQPPADAISPQEDKDAPEPAQRDDESVFAKDEARRDIMVGNDAKYLAAMGIDPSILDGRSAQFGHWLDYFAWVPGEHMRAKHLDDAKLDIEREINRAQAGGWLARINAEDERVGAIRKGIDVAMAECDELDNLLTLYSVELSVSFFFFSFFLFPCTL